MQELGFPFLFFWGLPMLSIAKCILSPSVFLTLYDPLDSSPPGSSVRGIFPGKNTRVGCHSLLQEIFDPGIKPTSPVLAGRFFATEPPGKSRH